MGLIVRFWWTSFASWRIFSDQTEFTPAHVILFRGSGRWGMLLIIWAAAATGIILKTVFSAGLSEGRGLVFYLVLGWLGTVSGVALGRRYGLTFIQPLLWGGMAYTLGALVDFLGRPVLVPGPLRRPTRERGITDRCLLVSSAITETGQPPTTAVRRGRATTSGAARAACRVSRAFWPWRCGWSSWSRPE
jgi:predicted membrane channel-forming protein YqfA (hemolysin III family)